jgi:hypothetical protein
MTDLQAVSISSGELFKYIWLFANVHEVCVLPDEKQPSSNEMVRTIQLMTTIKMDSFPICPSVESVILRLSILNINAEDSGLEC